MASAQLDLWCRGCLTSFRQCGVFVVSVAAWTCDMQEDEWWNGLHCNHLTTCLYVCIIFTSSWCIRGTCLLLQSVRFDCQQGDGSVFEETLYKYICMYTDLVMWSKPDEAFSEMQCFSSGMIINVQLYFWVLGAWCLFFFCQDVGQSLSLILPSLIRFSFFVLYGTSDMQTSPCCNRNHIRTSALI